MDISSEGGKNLLVEVDMDIASKGGNDLLVELQHLSVILYGEMIIKHFQESLYVAD